MQHSKTSDNIKSTPSTKEKFLDLSFWPEEIIPQTLKSQSNVLCIKLTNTRLSSLPVEIKYLCELKEFYLSDNLIKIIPPEIGALSGLKVLDLRNNDLSHLPPEIGQLSNLEELNLAGNSISSLPKELGNLCKLKRLILNRNRLSELPIELCKLQNLQILEIKRNQLKYLPKKIGNLKNIERLSLNENRISHLPSSIGKLNKIRELFAASNHINILPRTIDGLISLRHLNLACNRLKTVPPKITKLYGLKRLKLCCNQFYSLPEKIGELSSLEKLYASYNNLDRLPYSIGNLKNLKILDLTGNKLKTIPPTIGRLLNLEVLELRENRLNYLPPEIGNLENIICLYLEKNLIHRLPSAIGRLKCLTILNLNSNKLRSLPQEIGKVINLSMLKVSNNEIQNLPICIGFMSKLAVIVVEGNNFNNIPDEITQYGTESVKSYLKQLSQTDKKIVYEIKLLVVGDGRVGKTSLTKKILDPQYVVGEIEPSTEGIGVHKWVFQTEDSKAYTVNIWDFGGQEIYYDTHKFFLTENSLYFIVVDPRKNLGNFQYWLELVRRQGKNSPILVIKNEKNDNKIVINYDKLREDFISLKEILATNLKTERGFSTVIRSLKYYTQSLIKNGVFWPNSWLKIRQFLENHPAYYISIEEFYKICDQHGVVAINDKYMFSAHLHDIGACLHFQKDDLLNKIIILKPEWGTDAVYKIFNADKVIKNFGKFNRNDLRSIWTEYRFENRHGELLQLMKNFHLCYELYESPGEYLAPALLSETIPAYELPADDPSITFLIKYRFMPKSIISRLIVAMNYYIKDQDLIWKRGFVLIDESNCIAEITEDYKEKNVKVTLIGRELINLFNIIEHEIDKIHRAYSLAVAKFISCNCLDCQNMSSPYFHNLRKLRNRLKEGIETVKCDNSNLTLQISELLKGKTKKAQSIIKSTLERNMGHSISINSGGGDVVVSLDQATAKILKSIEQSSDLSLQKDLETLVSKTTAMLETGLLKDTDDINSDLELFVNEAVKEKPRRKWLEVSSQGMIEAAETAGKVGKPIIDLIGSILKIIP